jgi:hypothetical protein
MAKKKKKVRIANRQARGGKNRKRPIKKPHTKYESLRRKVNDELLKTGIAGKEMEFTEPPDGVKMSEVILKLAEPLLEKFGADEQQIRAIVSLTIMQWNKLMLPEDEQENFQVEMIDILSQQSSQAEMATTLSYIFDLIAERKKKLFPNLKKFIVNNELIVLDGKITLNIASTNINSDLKPR